MRGERNPIAVKCADEILADFTSKDDIGAKWDVDDKAWVYETIRQIVERHLTPAAPEWTAQKPTVPGWYWYRPVGLPMRPKEVFDYKGKLYVRGYDWLVSIETGEWSGPIPPPGGGT